MFGNAPKALWTRWVKPDEENRIPLACRTLLVKDGHRHILFETGIGLCFEPKLADRFGVFETEHVLLTGLEQVGLSHHDIDVVVLSHLHFDHAGGLLTPYEANQTPDLLFPNATYVVGKEAWERALNPHYRDRASFLPHLNQLLEASGRLLTVEGRTTQLLGDDYTFHISHGHTPGLLLTEINMPDGPIVFAGDLIPGTPWVHLPITMGYDRYPELLIEEKEQLLSSLLSRNGRLFFTHDHEVAMATVAKNEKGKYLAAHPLDALVDYRT